MYCYWNRNRRQKSFQHFLRLFFLPTVTKAKNEKVKLDCNKEDQPHFQE